MNITEAIEHLRAGRVISHPALGWVVPGARRPISLYISNLLDDHWLVGPETLTANDMLSAAAKGQCFRRVDWGTPVVDGYLHSLDGVLTWRGVSIRTWAQYDLRSDDLTERWVAVGADTEEDFRALAGQKMPSNVRRNP